MKKINICLLAVFMLLLSYTDNAQDDRILEPGVMKNIPSFLFGAFGGINYNMHSGGFKTTDGNINCTEFDDGKAIKGVVGLKLISFFAGQKQHAIIARFMYEGLGGDFTSNPPPLPIFGKDNQPELMFLEDELKTSQNAISFDIMYSYHISNTGLYVALGPGISNLTTKEMVIEEKITNPPGSVFLDGKTTKTMYDGEIKDINSIHLSIKLGAGWLYGISNKVFINPEIMYNYYLTKYIPDYDWKSSNLQFTLGIMLTSAALGF